MNKNTNVFIIIGIVVIAVVIGIFSYGKIGGSRTNDKTSNPGEERAVNEILEADSYEKVDISTMATDYDEIQAIYKGMDKNEKIIGYAAFLTVEGYGGPLHVNVAYDEKAQHATKVQIGENQETEGVGTQVEAEEFLQQFVNAALPIAFSNGNGLPNTDDASVMPMRDGVYTADGETQSTGYKAKVEIEVSDGKIVSASWDETNENGESKKNLSIKEEYNMDNDGGLRWHEQAELMENLLVEFQDPYRIPLRQDGKTDAVSGVSISVSEFVRLADTCVREARGIEYDGEKRAVEAISGATISSTAVINAVNIGAEFIGDNLAK